MTVEEWSEVCAPWTTPDKVTGLDEPVDADLLADSIKLASDVLYNFTKRRWPGACTDTVRPCLRVSGPWPVGWRMSRPGSSASPLAGLQWFYGGIPPLGFPGCGPGPCSCEARSEVPLPGRPVTSITEVKIDGVVVDPANYVVRDRAYLVAVGDQRWPSCQQLTKADTEAGTFSVAYEFGAAPPSGGSTACRSLAQQLYIGLTPATAGKCRLPKRVTSINRQGVSIAVLDPLTLFVKGQTGLAEVDMWIAAVNMGSNQRRATVVDPLRHASSARMS